MTHPGLEPLVGREVELDRVLGAIAAKPLVTIRGTAGAGKTRLATEVGRRRSHVLVELEPLEDELDVTAALATALALVDSRDDTAAAIERALPHRGPLVVILDRAEGLVAELGPLVMRWIAAAPELRVLVTSQVALDVPGEAIVDLEPLPTPPEGTVDRDNPALALLLELVDRRGGRVVDDDLPLLARLARDVGGIPHALELAASRVVLLGAKIASRTETTGVAFLSAAGSSSPLLASVRASVDLLPREAHRLLLELAVLPPPLDMDAIEAVASPQEAPIADLLADLRARSLVRLSIEEGREPRYALYEHVRAVALKDRNAPVELVRDRYGRWIAKLAERIVRDIERDGVRAYLHRTQALRSMAAGGSTEQAIHAAHALAAMALAGGPLEAADRALDRLLRDRELGESDEVRLRAARARILRRLGKLVDALAEAERAVAVAGRLADPALESEALEALGPTEHMLGHVERAAGSLSRAIARAEEANAPALIGRARAALARSLIEVGRLDEARAELEAALPLFRRAGLLRSAALATLALAAASLDDGGRDEADRRVREVDALAKSLGDPHIEARAIGARAGANHLMGIDDADAGYRNAIASFERLGLTRPALIHRGYRGVLAWERGDLEDARATLASVLEPLDALGDPRFAALFGAALAGVLAELGDASARAVYARARKLVPAKPADVIVEVVELLEAGLELGEGRRDEARARVTRVLEAEPVASFDLDVTLLALRARLRPAESGASATLEVARSGDFVRSGGSQVLLAHRESLRNILAKLVEARANAPGAPIDRATLRESGWPGERMLEAAARQRVRTALATLRRVGLRDVLRSDPRGWFLDPAPTALKIVD